MIGWRVSCAGVSNKNLFILNVMPVLSHALTGVDPVDVVGALADGVYFGDSDAHCGR